MTVATAKRSWKRGARLASDITYIYIDRERVHIVCVFFEGEERSIAERRQRTKGEKRLVAFLWQRPAPPHAAGGAYLIWCCSVAFTVGDAKSMLSNGPFFSTFERFSVGIFRFVVLIPGMRIWGFGFIRMFLLSCVPRAFGHNSMLLSNAAVMFWGGGRAWCNEHLFTAIYEVGRFKRHIRIISWYSNTN